MIPLPAVYGVEILRTEVGSTLHGTGLGVALEDHDEMGIAIEWPHTTIGLGRFEQWTRRTARDRPHEPKTEPKSEAGDTDLCVYGLRKWAKLALNGNPSVLLPLFAPSDKVLIATSFGDELRGHADWFASRRAGRAFLGYMERQRQRMLGQRGKAGRVRTMPDGQVDWKYAMHMVRLGLQGVEFLTTGRISVPMREPFGEALRNIRQGTEPLADIIDWAESLEARLRELLGGQSPLPDDPDVAVVDDWVTGAHLRAWDLWYETLG